MSDLIVVTFDSSEQAQQARDTVKRLQGDGQIALADAAVITKSADGKLKINNEMDRSVKVGAGVGTLIGLLFSLALPGFGMLFGAAGGALVGKLVGGGAEKKFIKEVAESIPAGGSALFLVIDEYSPAALRVALDPFSGQLHQTTLDSEISDQLRRALRP